MQQTTSNKQLQIDPISFIADFLLTGMVIGPIAAPFLAASGLPILPQIANIIYFMGHHVCPQPPMAVELAPPFIMAVCMRCYGTVMGLFATRLLYITDKGKAFYWLHQYGWNGVALATVLMMAYPLEMAAQILGWWNFHNLVVAPFGLITGLAWGLFTMPILHRNHFAVSPDSKNNCIQSCGLLRNTNRNPYKTHLLKKECLFHS